MMLDTKYALKYKMPHSLLHIVDNSMYRGELQPVTAEDPSLYSTIVVTATPIGVDNKVVTLSRSDVASVSFGLDSVTSEDIEKYGQTITYPMSIIQNGTAPVKLLRITPDGSTYANAIILVQWRIDDDKIMHVRFVRGELPGTIKPDRFKSPEKLNAAIISQTDKTVKDETDATVEWNQRVFINAIAAGRGKVYNNLAFAINLGQVGRRPTNCRYEFLSINNGTIIERFYASLSNGATSIRQTGQATLDDVNTVVSKRMEGSSIIVPFLNNDAVRSVYNDYTRLITTLTADGDLSDEEIRRTASLNMNIFEMIYGTYIYEGSEADVPLPHYNVDMLRTDIARLQPADRYGVYDPEYATSGTLYNPYPLYNQLYSMTTGVMNDGDPLYIGDAYLTPGDGMLAPSISVVGGINQYSGAVTSISFSNVYAYDLTANDGSWLTDTLGNRKAIQIAAYINDVNLKDVDISDGDANYQYEKLIEGNAPNDWGSNNNTFYTKSGDTYTAVNFTATPPFEANTYYSSKSQDALITEEPANWGPGYGTCYTHTGDDWTEQSTGWATVPFGYDPVYEADTYYRRVTDPDGLISVMKESKSLAKQIKNGNIPLGTTVPIACVYTLDDGSTVFEVVDIFCGDDPTEETEYKQIIKAVANPVRRDVLSLIPFSDKTGNVFGIKSTDSAYARVGATVVVIDSTNNYASTVYVNGYNVKATDTSDRILVTANSAKFGTVPNSINISALKTLMNHEYDVMPYAAPDDINGNEWGAVKKATINADTISSDGTTTKFTWGSGISGVTAGTILTATAAPYTELTFVVIDDNTIKFTGGTINYTDDNKFNITGITGMAVSGTDNKNTSSDADDVIVTATVDIDVKDLRLTEVIPTVNPTDIYRYMVTGSIGSLHRVQIENTDIPYNYYSDSYGINPSSADGGVTLAGGSTGFFDQAIDPIEFKWRYSELLVKAYRGQIDPRIMSPTRCPAKFLFDGGTNTVIGQTVLSNLTYRPVDILNASTIFTEDEKDRVMYDESIVTDFISTYDTSTDIDVKQAMYDLMVYRCYYGLPEDKRPIGPGYGLSLHLDAGATDAASAALVNKSFSMRFTNPNASWDIGGYVSSADGIAYTYTKWIADNLIKHCKEKSINKPFVMGNATIPSTAFTSFFPDIDLTDWDFRELMYNSGGNSWVIDVNGNLLRRSQRTLQTVEETSDLIQESNMRTLSQLCYLLQNKIEGSRFEYNDDGVLKTLSDQVNNMFTNWVGWLVDDLDISFERDTNPTDGGDIVVCYCNVTFRGLILRVPIIVNVQRRTN